MDTQEGYNREALIKDFLQNLGMGETDIHLVNMALTHSSYSFEKGAGEDNERLEFLGDAVLGFIVSRYLFERYPQADEGSLSKMKARIVSGPLLARRAEELGLAPFLFLGKGEEQIGGRESPNLLSRALESLLGAFYLSAPFERVSQFILGSIIEPAETLLLDDEFADYKSRLQEYAQRQFQCVPEYRVISETGPDHNKSFTVEALIQGKPCGSGTGSRKKTAENEAARVALEHLQ